MLVTELTPDQVRNMAFAVMQIALLAGFVGTVLGWVAINGVRALAVAYRSRVRRINGDRWLAAAAERIARRRQANGY